MISPTMPLLTIHHKTEYRYTHPVAFGEHRIMLRPRDGHDLMATGRDAADVALTTSFGRMDLVKFLVISDEVVAA